MEPKGHPPTLGSDGRFQIQRELGRGGMGVVYEAYDRRRDETVALKTLHWMDGTAIYRLKREFRTLANVAHTNLVQLYELIAHDDVWFFTMELIQGVHFLDYARPKAAATPGPAGGRRLDATRLREGLRQLAAGVVSLHQAGKVHRDLKPSNVLVTNAERLVLLDFGIAAEFGSSAALRTGEDRVVGTIEYMSPEQCMGDPSAPPSDWYAVGALLYEALTGSVPFAGSSLKLLALKQSTDPPSPSDLAPDLPPDLVDLCVRLLSRTPANRPGDLEVLRAVGLPAVTAVIDRPSRSQALVPLVGRRGELARLEAALAAAGRGSGLALLLQGPSGIGKSALVRHFTDGLLDARQALVLTGRCYVSESMPYKALDGVIDKLTRLLDTLPPQTVEAALPADIAALARVFPVLRRVPMVDDLAATAHEIPDRRELRRRAFAALQELLGAICRDRPVVMHIDDLQWADRDSADLLDELLRQIAGMKLLIILSFRSEEASKAPLLRSLLAGVDARDRQSLELGPLPSEEAVELARRVLGEESPDLGRRAQTVAEESDGNPFLIDQMARMAASTELHPRAAGLGEMIEARVRQMPDGAAELVEVLAVAGQPTDAAAAYRAAGLSGDERPLVASLRIAHLLRAGSTADRIELYHDRIREHYARRLDPAAARRLHLRLAQSLESRGIDEPEVLCEHYLGAGEPGRAAPHAARAAEAAQAALAFERAAQFYQRALDCTGDPAAVPVAWYAGLGDALASAGRGAEAATAYLRAAERSVVQDALEMERRAGEQLLISGHIREGVDVIGRVLHRVGLRLARSSRHALVLLLLRRLRLRLRGLRFREHSPAEIPPDQLARIDACWSVAEGLALIDPVQAYAFQSLLLLLALKAGDANRIALGLALEAGFRGSSGAHVAAERLLDEAEHLARRVNSQPVLGLSTLLRGTVAYHTGRLRQAADFTRQAETILSEHVSFSAWPLSTARVYRISIFVELGEVAELCRLSRIYIKEASDRGNIFASTMFLTGWSSLVWLAADDVTGAQAALQAGKSHFPAGSFLVPHYNCMLAQGLIDLYAGDGGEGYRRLVETWPGFERSLLMRIRTIRIHALHLRARCALAAASAGVDAGALLRVAERVARQIAAQELPSRGANRAKARLLRAGIEAARGRPAVALQHLSAAVPEFERQGMALWCAVAQRRRGELLGGDEGRVLVAQADTWMTGQGIKKPERVMAVFAPGFGSSS
ncbi:MAG: AAA family ATPase [Gemmatimonadetes bacterium]|nr:AAA family ATPase [Gemmatimonadota bacterium]